MSSSTTLSHGVGLSDQLLQFSQGQSSARGGVRAPPS